VPHRCTRSNYDSSLLIREIKRFIAAKFNNRPNLTPEKPNGKKVAIIGAGPSGLSCAYFLALDGFAVEMFETRAFAGGMVSDAIPSFRLTAEAIERDIEYIKNLRVRSATNRKSIKRARTAAQRLRLKFISAIGAQGAKLMGIPVEDTKGVIDQLYSV
jgi:putative selenate reductase